MANKGLLKVSANQSFLGFTQSPQKTPKQEFSGGLFLFVRVIPKFSFKVRFDLQNLRFLRISIKNEKIPDGRRWCQNLNLYITKLGDEIENLTRTYGSLLSNRSNFF